VAAGPAGGAPMAAATARTAAALGTRDPASAGSKPFLFAQSASSGSKMKALPANASAIFAPCDVRCARTSSKTAIASVGLPTAAASSGTG
jgi:hypothetical protein